MLYQKITINLDLVIFIFTESEQLSDNEAALCLKSQMAGPLYCAQNYSGWPHFFGGVEPRDVM